MGRVAVHTVVKTHCRVRLASQRRRANLKPRRAPLIFAGHKQVIISVGTVALDNLS
jgi:hypothetical protein